MAVVVGLDIGNGWTKAVEGRRSVCVPSVVGPAVRIAFRGGLADAQREEDLTIESDGRAWFVGELAIRQSPQPLYPNARYRDPELLRALMFGALFRLGVASGADVRVVTGLPIDWYQPADVLQMRTALEGEHRPVVNGRPLRWTVTRCECYPQPFGSLAYEVLRPGGDQQLISKRTAYIDIGQGTTNCAWFEALEYVDYRSMSFDAGMALAHDILAGEVADRFRADLSPSEAEAVLRSGRIELHGESYELDGIVERARAAVVDAIVTRTRRLWSDGGRLYRIYATGGGAYQLCRQLEAAYPGIRLVADAQMANARGFRLYGTVA